MGLERVDCHVLTLYYLSFVPRIPGLFEATKECFQPQHRSSVVDDFKRCVSNRPCAIPQTVWHGLASSRSHPFIIDREHPVEKVTSVGISHEYLYILVCPSLIRFREQSILLRPLICADGFHDSDGLVAHFRTSTKKARQGVCHDGYQRSDRTTVTPTQVVLY